MIPPNISVPVAVAPISVSQTPSLIPSAPLPQHTVTQVPQTPLVPSVLPPSQQNQPSQHNLPPQQSQALPPVSSSQYAPAAQGYPSYGPGAQGFFIIS